jgi:Ca2+-binding EF-hand superfamily protein
MAEPVQDIVLTDEQMTDFKEAFALFDKDGDGAITADELATVMRSLGQYPSNKEVKNLLKDKKGGLVDFKEFMVMMINKMKEPVMEDEVREAFLLCDNENGYISARDIKSVMTNLGEILTAEELADLMKEADPNKTGKVEFDAFVNMLMTG